MDTLTHTVLGACLGETIAGRQFGKKAMLIGALANNFPDVDVVSHFFTSQAEGLLAHRGITHSIMACTVLTPVFAYMLKKMFRDNPVSIQRLLLLIGSGLFIHILMDAFTSYGTGWFEPFSHQRVSMNTLFILDPFFLLPLLVAAIALLILKKTSLKRKAWTRAGLTISAVYLLLTICIKLYVNNKVSKDLLSQNIPNAGYMVTPTPLNNLLWYVVTKNSDSCRIAYYSVFDKTSRLQYEVIPKRDNLLAPYKKSAEVQKLIRFSKDYYSVAQGDSSLVFSDLRFGQIGGWYKKNTPFVFNFDIIRVNNSAHIQQGRMKSFESDPLKELVKRIRGKS